MNNADTNQARTMEIVRPALVLFIALSAITGLAYPFVMTGVGKLAFAEQANGSLVARDGKVFGSTLIGQSFSDPGHFWGRPSATAPMSTNASASGGSNQGPLNPALIEAVKSRVEALRKAAPDNKDAVPVDLVTASASGLDPHISPAAAAYQVDRVATARKLSVERVRALVEANSEGPQWGFLGEARVNVFELNLALDALAGR